jgi:hypothetical protein
LLFFHKQYNVQLIYNITMSNDEVLESYKRFIDSKLNTAIVPPLKDYQMEKIEKSMDYSKTKMKKNIDEMNKTGKLTSEEKEEQKKNEEKILYYTYIENVKNIIGMKKHIMNQSMYSPKRFDLLHTVYPKFQEIVAELAKKNNNDNANSQGNNESNNESNNNDNVNLQAPHSLPLHEYPNKSNTNNNNDNVNPKGNNLYTNMHEAIHMFLNSDVNEAHADGMFKIDINKLDKEGVSNRHNQKYKQERKALKQLDDDDEYLDNMKKNSIFNNIFGGGLKYNHKNKSYTKKRISKKLKIKTKGKGKSNTKTLKVRK